MGGFPSVRKAKRFAAKCGLSGVFNILGPDSYRDSWYVPKYL